ncbi:MAG: hypothetical protein Q4C87_10940 [Actinomycetaceae bacterium]|nr:hypothetical protein [Actinomycetaceae bacterium]
METIEWPGILDPETLKPHHVERAHRLADAAKSGNWAAVFDIVGATPTLSANQWRIGGSSWFAPLHQAAWLGAPVEVVNQLITRGAWRSLRTAEGDRPIDIARRRHHQHLEDALAVPAPNNIEARRFAAWDQRLSDLISERTGHLPPVRIRPVPTEVIVMEPLDHLWFAYPGMYGGFAMSVHRNRLVVESWSRVVGGSGQAHVITEGGCVLVEQGFV